MKAIFLGQNIAYGAKVGGGTIVDYREIDKLDTGALCFFTKQGVKITAANITTVLDNQSEVYIAVGNQQTIPGSTDKAKSQISLMIPRLGTSATKQVYVAPIAQRSFAGSNGSSGAFNQPSTLVAGTEANLKVVKTTEGLRTIGAVYESEIKRYSVVVLAGDTIATIADRLIAQINADTADNFVTATAVQSGGLTTGIQVDSIDPLDTFSLAVDGILINATITKDSGTNARSVTYGKGTDAQMAALELAYSTERGNTNQIHLSQYYYKTPSLVVSGATYDTYTIAWQIRKTLANAVQNASYEEIVIAMPQGATQQANFETIMAEIFQMLNSPVETGS